jgi:hypothetical protein
MKLPTAVVLSMSLTGDWLCAASTPVRVPLDVSIDGVYQTTNAVVEMPFETIGMPLSAWKPLAKDSTAVAFVRLLAGISSGQYQEVEPLYTHESRKDKPGVADGSVVIEHIPVRQLATRT